MRVAIHFKDGSVAAYKLGRVEDGVHNSDILTGAVEPLDGFVDRLMKMAQDEFAGDPSVEEIVLEKMVMDDVVGDTSTWIPVEEYDPDVHTPTRPGNQVGGPELVAQVAAETGV